MDDLSATRAELLAEIARLRRRIAELEASEVDLRCAGQVLEKAASAAEEAMRTSEATAEALLAAAAEGVLVVDHRGRILRANRAAERMFGYAEGALAGQPVEVLLPHRLRDAHAAHRARYFAEPHVRPMGRGLDLVARRKDGNEFPVEISLSYVQSAEGMVAMAFVSDIADRHRAEAELQRQREALYRSERLAALGHLAAGVGHEMNNALGIMTARLDIMLAEADGSGLPPELVEDLRVLHRSTARVADIARALRSFERLSERGRRPLDLNAVVRETLILVQKPMSAGGIRVSAALAPSLPWVLGDAGQLQQVLLNLLTNAQDAMTGGGEARIATGSAAGDPPGVRLVVADTGPGIAAENLPRILEPYYTTRPGGTGLGLALSHSIVLDHGGTLDVQSEPGQGTTFIMTFPALPLD